MYSCSSSFQQEFGAEVVESDGVQIDACCLADSPDYAVESFCRIDSAEEICRRGFNLLNAFRKSTPVTAQWATLNQQLYNLSKFLADAETQTECSQHVGKALKDTGKFNFDPLPLVVWAPVHPEELDPDTGWPWFRGSRLNLTQFAIDDFAETDLLCNPLSVQTVQTGSVTGGLLTIGSSFGNATPNVTGGHFSFRSVDCGLDTCEFGFDEFMVEIEDFVVGSLTFSDVSLELSTPAQGLISAPSIQIEEGAMQLTARFRLTSGVDPMFDGDIVPVVLSNVGVATARLLAGPLFGIQHINAVNWPFTMSLTTELAPCDP